MMRTPGALLFCLLSVIPLSCESAYQQLHSIKDLKKLNFEESVPKHTLVLLHWFANTVDTVNNVVCLNFDPNNYGSHIYYNREHMLEPLPQGYRYYSVGSLSRGTSHELPDYVRYTPVQEFMGRNRDRIIFRIQEQTSVFRRIDRVYITQHYRSNNSYDPEYTYQISTNLLREIRLFSTENLRPLTELRDQFHSTADDDQLRDISNTWGSSLAYLGLLLFIVIKDKYSNNRLVNNRPVNNSPVHTPVNSTRGYNTPVNSTRGYNTPVNSTRGYNTPVNSTRGYNIAVNNSSVNKTQGNNRPVINTQGYTIAVNNRPQMSQRQTDYVVNIPEVSNNNATENCGPLKCIVLTIVVVIIIAVIGYIIFRT